MYHRGWKNEPVCNVQCAFMCDFMWDKTREAKGSFEL